MFWGVLGVTAAALLFVLLCPFRVRVTYSGSGGTEPLTVSLVVLGRTLLHLSVPLAGASAPALDTASGGAPAGRPARLRTAASFVKTLFFDTGQGAKGRASGMGGAVLRALKTCEKLEWETQLGTGDAALTALAAGGLWALKGTVYTALASRIRFTAPPRFAVLPIWDRTALTLRIDCIFRLRLGEIILAWAYAAVHAWRKGEGRFGKRQGPAPD